MADVGLLARYKVDNSDFTKKTNEAKRSLEQFGIKGTEVGNKLSSLTSALNINIGSLSKMAVGLGAASAALKVASDAFKQNEVVMDEFNRNIEAAKGVYDGFLNALNTGDISGYLQNINNIVKAARDAYDAMDELGTFNAFNQINYEENRANLSEALANFKSGTGGKDDITKAAQAVKDDLTERQKLEQNAYDTAIKSLAEERGVNADMLREAMTGKYGHYQTLKNTKMTGTETVYYSGGMFGGGGSYQKAVAANEQEKLGEMLRKLTDDELKDLQAIGAQAARTGHEIADVDKQVARYMKEGSGGGGKVRDVPAAVGSMDEIKQQITKLNKDLSAAVTDEARANIRAMIAEAEEKLKGMQGATKGSGIDLSMSPNLSSGVDIGSDLKSAAENMDLSGVLDASAIVEYQEKWNELQESFKNTAANEAISAFDALGNAIGGTEGAVVKLIAQMAQQIVSGTAMIANLYMQAAAAKADATAQTADAAAKTMNAHAWIPWVGVAMGVSMVATMIATLTSLPKFANGGMIEGNKYSGDQQLARVNAGEIILNRAQQANLASQLSDGAEQQAQPYLQAETIFLGINNYLRRTGRGEIITTL